MPQDHWARDPEDLVPEEEGTGTCGDVPGTSAVEGLGPAEAPEAVSPAVEECTGATGAAGQLPGPFLFAHARPGGKSIAGALARLHREGQAADGVKIRRLDHGPLLSRDFEALEIRTMAEILRDTGFIVIDEPVQEGHSFFLQAHRGSSKAMQRPEVLLGALGTSAGECIDECLTLRDFGPCPWDPAWCAPPDIPDGPRQKGRSPKAYHHQFQPGEGRRETAPSRTTRDAARKARKKKKR